jgi:hypothetical protein
MSITILVPSGTALGGAFGGALGDALGVLGGGIPTGLGLAPDRVVGPADPQMRWTRCPGCGADVQVGAGSHDQWRSCWRCGRRVN